VKPATGGLPLVVSFPPSRIVRRLAGRIFMRGAVRYIQWLRRLEIPVVVTLHETRDLECAQQWLPRDVQTFYTEGVDELIARYEACRGVIGFRLHAALLALGLGKPIVPVGVDWRGLAFIETFQLADLAIRPMRLGQFGKLRRLTQLLLRGDPRLVHRLDEAKLQFRRRYESFLSQAAHHFSAAASSRAA
jgi:polysaccharide pyruvyl transferase WcaK-like protein